MPGVRNEGEGGTMKMRDVTAVLDKFGVFRYEVNPHGVEINQLEGPVNVRLRFQSGSGIACDDRWTLVGVADGRSRTPPCQTKRELRKALRELMAGERPPGARYARLNHNRFGDTYIGVCSTRRIAGHWRPQGKP